MRLLIALALLIPLSAAGQSSTVSGVITDSDGQTWNNGHGFATFIPGPVNKFNWTGGAIPNQINFTMNGSGAFSVSIPDNSLITPAGSAWNISICPNASAPCVSKQFTIVGATVDLTSQLSAIAAGPRFAATSSNQSYGYLDGEITPIPVPGGWYFNVTSQKARQWNGSSWQDFGGGSGGTPCATQNAIQFSNVSSFGCDPAFTINSTTHTRASTANDAVNAFSSTPRAVYDPMDTNRDGGLAAAIAGTSGQTATQVIQATLDFAECQILTGATPYTFSSIPLPEGVTIQISGLKMWANQSMGGDFQTIGPALGHNDATQYMIQDHQVGDTITCNGTTFNPLPSFSASDVFLHNFTMGGLGAVNTDTDIGIFLNGPNNVVYSIGGGGGNAFGGAAVIVNGTTSQMEKIGYPGSQFVGCETYSTGVRPVSGAPNGFCGSVVVGMLDGAASYIYASDGQAQNTGHAHGSCYPDCAAIIVGGANNAVDHLFGQVSSQDILVTGTNNWMTTVRADFASEEGVHILSGSPSTNTTSGNTFFDVKIDSACTNTAHQSAFNAGTPTNCFAFNNTSGSNGNYLDGLLVNNSAGIFAPSYAQAFVNDLSNSASGASSVYAGLLYQGSADNTTSNGWLINTSANGATQPRVVWQLGPPIPADNATPNVSGVTGIVLEQGQTVTDFIGGISGQIISVTGNGTVQNNPSNIVNPSGGNIVLTCTFVGPPVGGCNTIARYEKGDQGPWLYIGGTQ